MSIVICKLPRTGLGNQLFPLLKAFLFAHLNNLPVEVIGYNQIKIGPYLRREKSKRHYTGNFNFERGLLGEQIRKCNLYKYRNYEVIREPALHQLSTVNNNCIFLFRSLPHWSDYFVGLKDYRNLVIELCMNILSADIKKRFEKAQSPIIGVHVRMGDFRQLKEGEDFSKVGVVRTPLSYFIDVIKGIRHVHGSQLPVTVFSDGYKKELEPLLKLANLHVIEGNPDIVDLLLLSKSKIIVTSTGSTFSYWAGFMSDAPLIMHPDHIHQSIRPLEMQERIYEGAFDAQNHLLLGNIKAIA